MIALRNTILFLLLYNPFLYSCELQQEYIIQTDTVKLSDIIKTPKKDYILFNINPAKHSKRVRSSELLSKLKLYGYKECMTKHAYIQFSKRSSIETDFLKNRVKEYYNNHYKDIKIQSISLRPSKYMSHLPKEFRVGFARNAYLSHKGIFYIKTPKNRKYFFKYTLHAELPVYEATKEIKRGDAFSLLNLQKKSIILDKFRALPLMQLEKNRYEAKHKIDKGTILTQRDITGLYLIKRGANVTVTLQDEGVQITFSARAVQNGRYGDTITVQYNNNKKLRVVVIGKNRAKAK
ncbi:flagellar basal body P-ring formation chaperone FlgA [Sulfurimonas paralvinellae]|uniref:Flagellar basal body P-ring formation protein FlgA n=1 Tax=Sulfurimonas paralvinellae TaxID=317658 RepID=A0A7M1B7J6_9BACT|nr:flagellar basal body P-ring formation chaperone FlgA [Sulfurimonas paralvinellae]QOP45719.1 flagellar basal body P-ring formation protein FlgA [Sulfurimonas paralvinellae]